MHPLIVANWKMNVELADAVIMTETIKNGLEPIDDVMVVLCPSFPHLPTLAEILSRQPIRQLALGAQNVSSFERGPFTGEVSVSQLKNLVQYAIVGHSERVKNFNETPEITNQKVKLLLKNEIIPIVCVGEFEKGEYSLTATIKLADTILDGLNSHQRQALVLCYEPVWAISSSRDSEPADGKYAEQAAEALHQRFPETKIIYGGSVSSKNIREFTVQEHIEGALVGKASLDAKEFLEIVKNA